MPLQLKPYQQDCLDALAQYFAAIDALKSAPGIANPARTAFEEVIRNQPPARSYHPVPQLAQTPYVCLRVPTGGGKTFLAAHAVKVAADKLFRQDHILTLWLAPTNTIVDQTRNALRDRAHPYRQALDQSFGGNVTILSLDEAFYLQRHTLDASAVIIVSTFAGLNVEDTANRRVYDQNGSLMPAFTGLSEAQIRELTDPAEPGGYTPSLANLIRLRHPFIIMDEAHNARTQTAFNTLQRFRPLAILELTATPSADQPPSNVLYHVSAAQLKADHMIKLPIKLRCRPQWKEAVAAALAERNRLETLAADNERATGRYIRPIILFQAQHEREGQPADTPTAAYLKAALIAEFNVPKEQIAVATGKTNDLGDTDIFARTCPLRHIITVQKLREGWDCSFAYILCSVTNLSSHTAVEQLLGRIMRLPYADRTRIADLDQAYAFATSTRFVDTARDLEDSLVESGFSRFEAQANIEPGDEGALFTPGQLAPAVLSVPVASAPDAARLAPALAAGIAFDPRASTLSWHAPTPMPAIVLTQTQAAFQAPEDRRQVERLYRRSRGLEESPAALGVPFNPPRLAVLTAGQCALFEDQFRELPWSLRDADASILPDYFAIQDRADPTALVDVSAAGRIMVTFIEEVQNQLALYDTGPATITDLSVFLARALPDPDHYLTHAEKIDFVHRALRYLIDRRNLPLEKLCAARYKLVDALALRIDHLRRHADRARFNSFLLPDCATPVAVSPALAFQLPRAFYPAPTMYQGAYNFQRHYYKVVGGMNVEEAQCAALIDRHPKVKHWVRNLERRPEHAFWLQTSSDKFYPDFVAELTDGRYLIVEYKGQRDAPGESRDTDEKQMIGQLWQDRSRGACLFRLVELHNMEQILNAI